MKTTAPKIYCVRPNASYVKPGDSVDVQVILQGLKTEPELGYKCRDKFLLVTVPINENTKIPDNISGQWKTLEAAAPKSVVNTRIKVAYKYGDGISNNNTSSPSNSSNHSNDHEKSSIHSTSENLLEEHGDSTITDHDTNDGVYQEYNRELSVEQAKIDALDQQLEANKTQSTKPINQIVKTIVKKPVVVNKSSGVPFLLTFFLIVLSFFIGLKYESISEVVSEIMEQQAQSQA